MNVAKKQTLKLKQTGNIFQVVGLVNTVEWKIGQSFEKGNVQEIIRRNGPSNRVHVVIS